MNHDCKFNNMYIYIYTVYPILTPVHPDISSSAKNWGSMPNLWQDPTPSATPC